MPRMADGRDVHDATFACPDLTTFMRLDELGLEAIGQRLEPGCAGGGVRAGWRRSAGSTSMAAARSKRRSMAREDLPHSTAMSWLRLTPHSRGVVVAAVGRHRVSVSIRLGPGVDVFGRGSERGNREVRKLVRRGDIVVAGEVAGGLGSPVSGRLGVA